MKAQKSIALVMLLFVVSACGTQAVATEPPSPSPPPPPPTNTPAPTPTATLSPTPTPIPPTPTPEVQQFFTETFPEDYSDHWTYFLREGDEEKFSLTSTGDGLLFDLNGRGIFSYLVYEPFEYEEVRIDATVENIGVNDNNITLFCRYSPEAGWYEFNIYSSGLYDILFTKPDPAGNLNYGLIAEGGSNKINMGKATNKYSIICKKDSLSLFINDVETRTAGIPNYVLGNGKIGISASSFGQVPVQVIYKEVQISQP